MRHFETPTTGETEHARPRRAAGERIPATVVTGFLGAGKTTLVNHLIANAAGRRVAVIVNEFGEIGIDGALVAAAEGGVVELANGCICCSLNGDLVAAVARIEARAAEIDHLVVETTGLADPLPVALTLSRPDVRRTFRLDGVLGLVDAENFSAALFEDPAALNQLRYADLLLLNKADRVAAARLPEIEAAIRALGAPAPVLPAVGAAAPLAVLIGVGRPEAGPGTAAATRGDARADAHDSDHHDHHHHDPAADGFASVGFESDRPFAAAAFQAFLEGAGAAGIYRGKGLLWVAESEAELVFHFVGRRFSLDEREPVGPRRNRLVLIGRGLDADGLRARLARCLAGAPAPVDGSAARADTGSPQAAAPRARS